MWFMSRLKPSSGTMFARTLYRNDFGHVFFSVCAFSFWIESSDFSIFLFKAMVLSSYLVLLLVTFGLYVSEGRLRVAGDRWPLSSSSSLYNSSSSFTALISFSRSSAWPELDGPGNMLPSLSSILFILQHRKRYIDDIFSLWDSTKEEIDLFISEANRQHTTIKFTADISERDTNFLDTTVFKGERFYEESILDIRTHFKPTEIFQYTHFSSCHAPGVTKGFIKGEALRLLRTNSSKALFEENINNFKSRLSDRGYPKNVVEKTLIEVKFEERKYALQEKQKVRKNILPFVTQYNPSVPNLKKVLMSKWHIIEKQPLLREVFREPPIISYKRGRSLKDILVRAKL